MFDYKYLKNDQLKGFKKYKYSAIDTSPIGKYLMHPTWNTIVKITPKSIAPNVITFAGFILMLIAVLLLTVYDPEFYAAGGRFGSKSYPNEIPNWVFITCGVFIFLAYGLDGIDGKQARRLGVSGPLGELFDHGLDSYIVFLIPYALISVFGRDPEYSLNCFRGFLIVVSVAFNFYICHWDKYNTLTLYIPWGYDVSMWFSSALFIIEGVYGPGYYKAYVFGDYTVVSILEIVLHLVGPLTTLPGCVYNVYLSYKNRTGNMYPFLEMLRPLWSLFAVTAAVAYWGLYSKNDISEQYPRAYIFLYGTLFSNIASRLIIAEMCHNRCDLVTWMFWPLLAAIIISLNIPRLEYFMLHLMLILAVFGHIHYGVCMVRQICSHLNIKCFTVPKEKRK
ncbi:unnamed protein product [Arctia plantaginis]|uniref:Ethanolaminephosphotransferase n=1 Tax=Arctia plantaginis TaxID=874455 RepID=A0A8S1BE27_ARCPL|nr:unnamed protein product [Arctia plantaginis]